ncbi:uncharacterized protein LOC144194695 [Stigmatopora nigra]
MKLTPHQAPLYGRCMITVQLTDDELAMEELGAAATACNYFLLFAGSTQRHLSSTLRSGHDTLQALCPAHGCCEEVLVTLCAVTRGDTDTPEEPATLLSHVTPLAEQRFTFLQDFPFDMAQFLVSTVGRTDGLEGAPLLDECHVPLIECERLDESLASALYHIPLPPGWNLLGNQCSESADLHPRETLLHFSARQGLVRVTRFLLQQPGAKDAMRLPNKEGQTPAAIAELRGHASLQRLLAQAEADFGDIDGGPRRVQPGPTDARVVCREPGLHTLTQSVYPGRDPPSLSQSVEHLLHLTSHLHAKRESVLDLPSDCLHTSHDCVEGVQTETTDCPKANLLANSIGNGSSATCGCDSKDNNDDEESEHVVEPPGLIPLEDWVCLESKSSEGQEDVAQNFLGLREQPEGGSPPPVENLTPTGRSQEETDRDEGQEVAEGHHLSGKEVNGVSQSGGELVMGQSPSSDAPVGESRQDGEGSGNDSDLSDGPSLNEEEVENEDLAKEDVTGDDVIPESDVPPGGEGEPPPDVNNVEQNQETAGWDHQDELKQEPDRETIRSESEDVDVDVLAGQETTEKMEIELERELHVDPEPPGAVHGASSDDDVSFQSVGSCVIMDVFHPSEENIPLEEVVEGDHVDQEDDMTTNQSGTCSTTLEEPSEIDGNIEEAGVKEEELSQGTNQIEGPDLLPGQEASMELVEDENSNKDGQSEEMQVIVSELAGPVEKIDASVAEFKPVKTRQQENPSTKPNPVPPPTLHLSLFMHEHMEAIFSLKMLLTGIFNEACVVSVLASWLLGGSWVQIQIRRDHYFLPLKDMCVTLGVGGGVEPPVIFRTLGSHSPVSPRGGNNHRNMAFPVPHAMITVDALS